jgi:hypothetical protein
VEPLIVDQLHLVPATLRLPSGRQLHLLDGTDQRPALRFAALAVDVFAQPACCLADILCATALDQFADRALDVSKAFAHKCGLR